MVAASSLLVPGSRAAEDVDPCAPITPAGGSTPDAPAQNWNWHVQNTAIVQGYPGFSAQYSGPNSLPSGGETRETLSLDLLGGLRLWRGAELHVDGLVWQGFGVGNALGAEGFPNGEAFRLGTRAPDARIARLFIRQTIGFGGEREKIEDGPLALAGQQDVSRLTLTLGRMSVKDIFDNNRYANDPRTQFMNWALMANEAWDFPADSLGFITGFAAELNQPSWTLRYGLFQMPAISNGMVTDLHLADAWGMVTELEHRHTLGGHPGAVRWLAFLNRAHMGGYQAALDNPTRPADIVATRDYRYKYGFGLNLEQEISKNIGAFSRVGWSDGNNEGWAFSDVDRTATAGVSVSGAFWNRPDDTVGVAGVLNGISHVHQEFLAAGGTGILSGDGNLNYGWEKILEIYYNFKFLRTVQSSLDYQFISNPAFNRDRGPVSVFSARVHWEF